MRARPNRNPIVRLLSALLVIALVSTPAVCVFAQAAKPAKKAKAPAPEDVTLETKDGVSIRATWYAGLGKKASVPVIMLHGWEGQRGDYKALATMLQGEGHSIIVPDLRGHGESTSLRLPNGDTKEVNADSLTRNDLEAMARDVEACKRFLMEKNNAGELNIEMLCVIGADFSTIVAMRWAAADWSAPRLPAFKQGQDVKALVLLSPTQAYKGLTMREALGHPAIRKLVSVMLVTGLEDTKGTGEAKRIFKSLEGQRPKVAEEDRMEKQDLFLIQPPTSLEGTKLLGAGLPVPGNIARFIELRLVNKQSEYAWAERRTP